ncbi:hypothetical protein QBC46DRAFT_69099 [Diplogelasinospora grovesii]|uniref:Cyclin-D1-binding protein 1-like N-terminal domain-containing protein n=1 Tax=Diplogelasinospora grovesii TaxID=303347 RepID=A0AAN6NCC4_9PEZI|nr:hypothetical protein QBC46DRAFT_69099 [Diplogelasinospora grovesii]
MSSSNQALETLDSVVSNTVTLIDQLEAVAASIASERHPARNGDSSTATQPAPDSAPLDALALAHDSATLIKAHATKISLLIINEPFTPTAITKVLRELVAGPLPALASAVQLCTAERYTQTIQRDLSWLGSRVLKELKELVTRIPKDGKVLTAEKKNASAGAAAGKGSLAATGVLWAACDGVVDFSKRGFAGNLVRKAEQFRDTLKDMMEELKEWGEETGDDDEDDEDDEDGTDEEDDEVNQVTAGLGATSISDTQAMLDDLMNSQQYIPRDDPNKIRERLDSCLRRLRLTTLLYQATVKRRLKPLPHAPPSADSNISSRLDEIMPLLKKLPERFESLALAFYELDAPEIDRLMDQCFFEAFAVSELLAKPWNDQKDEFTDWALKYQVEIKKA